MITIIIIALVLIIAAYIYSRRYRIKTFVENVKASFKGKSTNQQIGYVAFSVALISGLALYSGVFDYEIIKTLQKTFALALYVTTIEFYTHYFINRNEDVDKKIIRSPIATSIRVGLFGLGAAIIIAWCN